MDELDLRFSLSDWSRAFSLRERAAGWRTAGSRPDPPEPLADAERAARRLARWQAQNPFSVDGFFPRRLAQVGVGAEELRILLGEPPEALAARVAARPSWLLQLERAWTTPPTAPFPLVSDLLDGSRQAGFLEVVRPLLDAAYSDLTAGLRALAERFPSAPFDPATAGPLLARNLPRPLVLLLTRTMVLELHLAGHAGGLTERRRRSGSRASSIRSAIQRSPSRSCASTRCSPGSSSRPPPAGWTMAWRSSATWPRTRSGDPLAVARPHVHRGGEGGEHGDVATLQIAVLGGRRKAGVNPRSPSHSRSS